MNKALDNTANLIINTAFLGDVILTLPMINKLKKLDPNFLIILIVRKGFKKFLKSFDIIDHIIEVNKKDSESYKQAVNEINSNFKINNTYCIHRSIRSYFFSLKIKSNKRIGFSLWFNFFGYFNRIKYNESYPEPIRLSLLLTHFEKSKKYIEDDFNKIKFFDKKISVDDMFSPKIVNSSFSEKLLNHFKLLGLSKNNVLSIQQNNIAILAPGSVWKTKQWTSNGFLETAQFLESKNYLVLILGTEKEKHIADYICKKTRAVNLCGYTNLTDCLFLIKAAKIFIGNDSGLTHMASLFQIQTIAIFGPTHLSLGYRPWNNNAQVISLNLKCSPCGKHGSNTCPIKTHDCMKKLGSNLVIESLQNNFNI